MKYKNGEEFLNQLYQSMHMSDIVMHTAKKSDTPTEKIGRYLERLERTHNIALTNTHKMEVLKKFYYDKYVIKELPENYINLQKRICRERGYGDIKVTEELKKEWLELVQKEQKYSLDNWIDYLTSDEVIYPMWFQNYVFQGILKLGKYDKEKGNFLRRTDKTVEPYLSLNREILSKIYDTVKGEIGNNELTEDQKKALENGESFQKLYLYYLHKMDYKIDSEETEGKWIKYEQGENYQELLESLQGKNTGWCTAGEEVCKIQLANGDFYVYYTKDKEGEYTNPRIAIRMYGKQKIEEVRGVGPHQDLESNMVEITSKKLDEFENKEEYLKKTHDMRLLTEIEDKVEKNIELTKEELRFLYEIDDNIIGFGYAKDPRIKEIKEKRNIKKDLSLVFNCNENQIATKIEDFEQNNITVYIGNLVWRGEIIPKRFSNLQCIIGSAYFENLKDATYLSSLQSIGGTAYFDSLKDATGLSSLQSIGEDAVFDSLKDATGLSNLQYIGSRACFENLEYATGLNNLQSIGVVAYFERLIDSTGLSNLESIGGDAYFNNLKDATGLSSLQSIGGYAVFDSLKDATGLSSLQTIERYAYFYNLEDATPLRQCNKYYVILEQVEENIRKNNNIENINRGKH